MNFFPRGAASDLVHVIQLCEVDLLCTRIAAWSFSIAGRAMRATPCCFTCVDKLRDRAKAADFPINVDRIQGDLCNRCGTRIPIGPGRLYIGPIGPFCNDDCARLVVRREIGRGGS
jgi:hypothetical protein